LTFVTCRNHLLILRSLSRSLNQAMREILQSLLDELGFDDPWKPVSRPALGA
jgi:hypothetical protein